MKKEQLEKFLSNFMRTVPKVSESVLPRFSCAKLTTHITNASSSFRGFAPPPDAPSARG